MAQIGRRNTLTIIEKSDHGLYLDGGELGSILLPTRYAMPKMQPGNEVDVFIYNDSEDRLVATTEQPYALAGEFAYLEVVSVHPSAGAFLDWGLSKDLLLPYREQGNIRFTEGDGAIVAVYVDEYTNRVVASTRLHNHLPPEKPPYAPNDPVAVLVYGDSPLGYKAIVDKRYRGLLYHAENSGELEPGDQFTGYVKKVHNDGKIDLRRDPAGYGRIDPISERILHELDTAGGRLPFNDKSSPEAIRATFDTSKKAFKQAIGRLYKARRIRIEENGIQLVSE
ncbi:MAG: GntR family transcriptional regulator [Verrucomicrobia bacterium]|jgi:predicted RNA-binding protein (virulence factor B family)|nr:GntR family transcriptional regulator [Verrucomicrobiota bacterium]